MCLVSLNFLFINKNKKKFKKGIAIFIPLWYTLGTVKERKSTP